MDDVVFAVGGKRSLFDGVVKLAGIFDFFELELRLVLVGRRQYHRPHTYHTIEDISAKFYIHDAEHIEVINLAVKYPFAVFNPVGADFVMSHPDFPRLVKENQADDENRAKAKHNPIFADDSYALNGKMQPGNTFDMPGDYQNRCRQYARAFDKIHCHHPQTRPA